MANKNTNNPSFLEFLPVNLFGAIMGLTGLATAWGWAEKTWGFEPYVRNALGLLAIVFFMQKKLRNYWRPS